MFDYRVQWEHWSLQEVHACEDRSMIYIYLCRRVGGGSRRLTPLSVALDDTR